jgi:hypothetical protein
VRLTLLVTWSRTWVQTLFGWPCLRYPGAFTYPGGLRPRDLDCWDIEVSRSPRLDSPACAARERRADAGGITRGEERHGEWQTHTELWSKSGSCRNRLKFVCFSQKKKGVARGIPTGTGWCRRCRRGKFFFCGSRTGGEGVGETERHRVCVCVCVCVRRARSIRRIRVLTGEERGRREGFLGGLVQDVHHAGVE